MSNENISQNSSQKNKVLLGIFKVILNSMSESDNNITAWFSFAMYVIVNVMIATVENSLTNKEKSSSFDNSNVEVQSSMTAFIGNTAPTTSSSSVTTFCPTCPTGYQDITFPSSSSW